ncbi:YesL family protein [Brevibacillus fluminis]|uniref:YesL family protein n=1 Tax=Brevibacillus fluminis TaxID=511487 RepID=UPI003F8889D9
MSGGRWSEKIMAACEWITRIVLLNLLWLGLTVLGLGILGAGPATAAVYTVTRKWVQGETDVPLLATCWRTYRTEFGKANALGWMTAIAGFILFMDYQFFLAQQGAVYSVLRVLIAAFGLAYVVIAVNLFPVFVHYDIRFLQCFKFAFFIGFAKPLHTLGMAAGVAAMAALTLVFPVLFPLCAISGASYWVMRLANRSFQTIEKRKQA